MPEPLTLPGPRPWPVLGANGNLIQFLSDPLRHIGALFECHGPVVSLVQGRRTRLVSTERDVPGTVFIHGPDLNRVLLSDHDGFHKCALAGPLYPSPPVSERARPLTRLLTGLFHVNGDEHRQQRRLLMPAFHKSRIEGYRDDMTSITEEVSAAFRATEVRDLRKDMVELTLRVATKTLFGADLGAQGLAIARDLQRWLELFRPSAILPWDLPGMPYRRWLDLSRRVDERMSDVVNAKRGAGRRSADMLSMLLEAVDETGARLSHDEVVAHAGVIFAAGHETSSNALCWTLLLLALHPRLNADVVDELTGVLRGDAPAVEQLARLPLLDAVIKESMRVFPPVPLNHRLCARSTELGGYPIPVGTEVITSIYHTHRIAELYSEPNKFRPERWHELDPGPYAYNPFGAGPRMCIGASFAMMELKIVLAILLQRFRFELLPGTRIDRFFSITLAPRPGLPLRVHPQDRRFDPAVPELRGNVREMLD